MATKKRPMRMCVGCRQMRPKKELVRVVRSAEGAVNIDPVGNARRALIFAGIAACLEVHKIPRARECF
jgi:predicted RNA-binding protein YlxR (DUF448 family)